MTTQNEDILIDALHRESAMMADVLGLDIDGPGLRRVKEVVVLRWIMDKMTEDEQLTVGDIMARYR